VPDGRYAGVVERLRPDSSEPGEIVHVDGRVLGRHPGVIHFTVGQRRGIGIAGAEPLYVVRLNAARRQVVVGPRAALACAGVALREINWLAAPAAGERVEVKLRSASPAVPAVVAGEHVRFVEPQPGVAPGQACVVYRGERLLGGGFIAVAEAAGQVAA
jgi:tRNA-specific 2-thiouridylase